MDDISVLNLFLDAGLVVKTVMIILLIASLLTWIVIVERYNFYKKIKLINDSFLDRFWSGEDLNTLYSELENHEGPLFGSLGVFKSAFKEFLQISKNKEISFEEYPSMTDKDGKILYINKVETLNIRNEK